MNDPGIIITVGVIFWLLVVVCFVWGFAWIYQNPRKAWEKGYHRQGLLWVLGGWRDRPAGGGEATAEELLEVQRRSMWSLVIALVLSPAIVVIAMVVGQARHQARQRWKPIPAPLAPGDQGAERAPADR